MRAVTIIAAVGLLAFSACSGGGSSIKKPISGPEPSATSAPTAAPSTVSTPSTVSVATTVLPSPTVTVPSGGPVPAGFVAASVTFIDDQHGWVLGNAPCAQQPCTTVLRTADGGASWRRVPAPPTSLLVGTDAPGAVDQLRFADPLDGFAAGEALWSTHDGAATWQRQPNVAGITGAFVREVAPTSGGVYALVSGTDAKGGGPDSHFRLARGDAGTGVFSVVADLGQGANAGTLVTSGSVVYLIVNQSPNGVGGQLLRIDGTAVTKTPLPSPSGLDCGHLAASTATALLLECGDGVASGSMGSRSLMGSLDSGRTFLPLPDPGQGAGYDDTGIADAGNGHAVIATTGNNQGALLSTSDGGRSWHESLSLSGDQVAGFGDLGFEDTTHGVVVVGGGAAAGEQSPYGGPARTGAGTVYRTTDSGRTWTQLAFH